MLLYDLPAEGEVRRADPQAGRRRDLSHERRCRRRHRPLDHDLHHKATGIGQLGDLGARTSAEAGCVRVLQAPVELTLTARSGVDSTTRTWLLRRGLPGGYHRDHLTVGPHAVRSDDEGAAGANVCSPGRASGAPDSSLACLEWQRHRRRRRDISRGAAPSSTSGCRSSTTSHRNARNAGGRLAVPPSASWVTR